MAKTFGEPPRADWLNPHEYPPPKGQKIFVLTKGGVSSVGEWGDDCKGWLPLPDQPPEMKRVGYFTPMGAGMPKA